MAALYPQQAVLLHHSLPDQPRLSIEALAQLGEGLPASEVEYNPGNVPIGIRPEDVPSNGLSIGETIRTIDSNGRWAVLKNIETVDAYPTLLMAPLGEPLSVGSPPPDPQPPAHGLLLLPLPGALTPFLFHPTTKPSPHP